MLRKSNPGHWCSMLRLYDSLPSMKRILDTTPKLKGFVIRVPWASLEGARGVYTFDELQSYVDWCAANKTKLIVMVEDKTFTNLESPLPEYLSDKMATNKAGGYTAIRWDPKIIRRWNALMTAIAKQFDSNPAFEGVCTEETAPSLSEEALDTWGYTPDLYREAYKAVIQHLGWAFKTSRFFWHQNFIPRGPTVITEILQWIVDTGQDHVVMGGPDCLQDNAALGKLTYPNYKQFNGKIPAYIHMSSPTYAEPYTVYQQEAFAKTELGTEYIWWQHTAKAWPPVQELINASV
jgi:hypothetical protein